MFVLRSAITEETKEACLSSPGTSSSSYFPASKLLEYSWPLSDPDAECFMLQEHVSEYLELRGGAFQRKYPDIQRRSLEYEERNYLVETGYITETQSNLGLLAVKSDDVLIIMQEEYPVKYKDYAEHLNQKYIEIAIQQNSELSKRITLSQTEFLHETDHQSAVKNAVHQVAEYNSKLLNQKWSNYYDGQTKCLRLLNIALESFGTSTFSLKRDHKLIIHQPVKAPVDKGYKIKSRYPVALIPGQYQDMYRKYTSQELKYLPLNTVLKKVQVQLQSKMPVSSSASVSLTTANIPLTISSIRSNTNHDLQKSDSVAHKDTNDVNTPTRKRPGLPKSLTAKRSRLILCSVCYKTSNLKGLPESLLYCSKCSSGVHPSCLQMNTNTAKVAKNYKWQCLECKTCTICEDPGEEDKMMCCDMCDRGYHSFCVGLKEIPSGHWSCSLCVSSSN